VQNVYNVNWQLAYFMNCPLLAIVRFRWLKPPLEQSAARRHLSSNDDCFRNRLETYLSSRSFPS